MKKILLSTILASFAILPVAAQANTDSPWQLRGRLINIMPQENSSVAPIAGSIDVSNEIVPELDISYFFTDNIAAELILATAKHDASHNVAGALGDAWILPPTLTVQYHFTPEEKFSPYLGAGLNYTWFYNEEAAAPFTDFDLEGGLGYALQAGFDYWVDDNWGFNADVKKLWLDVDASVNNGAVTADIELQPVIVGVGASYRF